ncbi:hypothetical protein HPP92_021494 [Vanilla planifolia]|uniref:Uncharacterized protein n=1 Tax=Vanilla planifolia TaxID=51239 RepID=A0A835Q1N4_VANPL|nr:hypothetical protein HPP92_021857 [Vanilla planifolia]KAG0463018.1 hypothetical protein HPP92_021494 [Vanilla planifolia]
MSDYGMEQSNFSAPGEEVDAGERKPMVFCPKPRRLSAFRWHSNHQTEPWDLNPSVEVLGFFLPKGGDSLSMSPPFFCGSPPIRSGNPVVRDARFGEELPVVPLPEPGTGGVSPSPPRNNGGCAREKYGLKPAEVRIEGFDCLDRDRRGGCSMTAVA